MKVCDAFVALIPLVGVVASATAQETPGTVAPTSKAISDEDANDLGARIEALALQGEVDALNDLVDLGSLIKIATAGISIDDSFWSGYLLGGRIGIATQKLLAKALVAAATTKDSSFHYLHPRGTAEARTLLFRILGSKSWSYLELRIERDDKSRLRCVDWLLYTEGEWGSEATRRELLSSAAKKHPELRDRVSKSDAELIDEFERITKLSAALEDRKFPKALELLSELPEDLRDRPQFLLQGLKANWKSGDETYSKIRSELKGKGWTTSMDLVDVGYQAGKKNDDLVLEDLRHLDAEIGGDAHVEVLISRVLRDQGKLDLALKSLQTALEREPTFVDAWWGSIEIKLKQKDEEGVYRDLVAMDERFQVEWNDMTKAEEYAEFVASQWHARWLEHLAAKR